jgi:hypothetical protein
MIHSLRPWLTAAVIAGAFVGGMTARAGEPDARPQVAWSASPPPGQILEPELLPPPSLLPEKQSAYVLPPATWPAVEFPKSDPLLDRRYAAQPGWYADVNLNVLTVHFRNQFAIPVPNNVTQTTDIVAFSGNKLDTAFSPRFELGYRFADGFGSVQLGYRFLTTQGKDFLTTGPEDVVQGDASQMGRLNYNIVDLDYVSREFYLDPNWELRWGVGMQVATLYYDSRLQFLNPASDPGTILGQQESNYLWCLGAHGILDLSRKLPIQGLAAFTRIEMSGNGGRLVQTGRELVVGNLGDAPQQLFENRLHRSIGNPMASWTLGLSYTVPHWNYSRFMLGYQYETWWDIGRVISNNSFGQLDTYGLFLRAEFNF